MSSPNNIHKPPRTTLALLGSTALLCAVFVARAELPDFLQHVVSASALEAALFRMMDLPGVKALYPRPPKEAQAELQKLLAQNAQQAELYGLKAREDEQALDFAAAEADWKAYAAHAKDPLQAKLQLAGYYHRRLQGSDEVQVLMEIGATPPLEQETFIAVDKQQSWMAFSRVVALADEDAMDPAVTQHAYEAWINRYPHESAAYANYFNWLLPAKQYDAATELVARYKTKFPEDAVFPVKATALVELRRGSVAKAMEVYDASFRPLWPQELIDSYFSLLAQTHQQRTFVGEAKARLEKNPDDFDALCRIYFYQKQSGRNDAAQAAVDQYRLSKDARKAPWSAGDLYTLMSMMQRANVWPEAARYAFALYNLPSETTVEGRSAQEIGLSAMADILLSAPDQPLLLGAQNLTMYRDIATMDQGPGYWNGILSLWLNSSSPHRSTPVRRRRRSLTFIVQRQCPYCRCSMQSSRRLPPDLHCTHGSSLSTPSTVQTLMWFVPVMNIYSNFQTAENACVSRYRLPMPMHVRMIQRTSLPSTIVCLWNSAPEQRACH